MYTPFLAKSELAVLRAKEFQKKRQIIEKDLMEQLTAYRKLPANLQVSTEQWGLCIKLIAAGLEEWKSQLEVQAEMANYFTRGVTMFKAMEDGAVRCDEMTGELHSVGEGKDKNSDKDEEMGDDEADE